jgi:hypothetical protein
MNPESDTKKASKAKTYTKLDVKNAETVNLNFSGAQESIPRNRFHSASLCSRAGWYDKPILTRFLAPIDCSKILALGFPLDC